MFITRRVVAVAALVLSMSGGAFADDSTKPPEPAATTPAATTPAAPSTTTAPAPSFASRFTFHGYLTQAYAEAKQHQLLGITEGGTANYRAAALQMSYAASDSDRFVVQVAHQREGAALIQPKGLALDWSFYEHRFSTGTSVKLGRVQVPFGIYNELRDVGTVLPFYRIPSNFYGEGAYTNETLDGVSVTQRIAPQSPWSLEASGYYGNWTTKQVIGVTVAKSEVHGGYGMQLWMNTPIDGLRIGAGGNRIVLDGGFATSDKPQTTYVASLDDTFGRFTTRAEVSRVLNAPAGRSNAWYAELSARVHPKLALNVQTDRRNLASIPSTFLPAFRNEVGVDKALGADVFLRSDVVLKLEAHRNRTLIIEDEVVNPLAKPPRADYFIASISVSF